MRGILLSYRVISIGTLAAHPLWNERPDVRTGHTTTTLVEAGSARILVNPGLPALALAARLSERTPTRAEGVTHVLLTSFQPDHRRGLSLFERAEWLIHDPERSAAAGALQQKIAEAESGNDRDAVALHRRDLAVLERMRIAPDTIVPAVDLFPLPGVTPGTCGLLLALPGRTVLITGDAVPTVEHLEQGKVLADCADLEQAQESFREAIEIADVLIPGRDNVVFNPLRMMM